ncbi:MaoC family dehydratase [Actinoplanes solisilvae]|uniref:MaoC family dehydratase n=1 Tax=Actinoplanes solisilvae TaxID=2486853 RepID=UPI0032C451D7
MVGLIPRRRGAGLTGVTLVRRGVKVDRSHLAAYDRVCGFRLNDQLPATYPHVLAFPLAMRLLTAPDFPFPAIGLVHIANRITVSEPLDAGSAYDLSVRAENLRAHERGRQVDIVATASCDGDEVWTSVSTYLSKEKQPARRDTASPAADRVSDSPPDDSPGHAADVASGHTPTPAAAAAVWRVPARVGTDYAQVSGDRNPIHSSRIGARLFGFPRPIAHGMWSLARCLAALEGRLPERYTVDVRFRQPILLPARVSFSWQSATVPNPAATTPDPAPQPLGGTFLLLGKKTHLAGQVTPE